MIREIRALHRIKSTKRDNALRALQVARTRKAEADAALERARAATASSFASMPARIEAVYTPVIGTVVDQGDLDDLRGEVIRIGEEHQRLVDAESRAAHIADRLAKEVEAAKIAYAEAERVVDKYGILRAEILGQLVAAAEAREDAEIEDLFARPVRGHA